MAFTREGTATVLAGLKPIFEELERERIALYPIDARGLTTAALNPLVDSALNLQFQLMENEAEATGGEALRERNRLGLEMDRTLERARNFYTLTFTPEPESRDGSWHELHIRVRGGMRLSYRHGYFADTDLLTPGDLSGQRRVRLMPDGEAVPLAASRDLPLIFQVHLVHGAGGLQAQYTVPADGLTWKSEGGVPVTCVDVEAQVLSRSGKAIFPTR